MTAALAICDTPEVVFSELMEELNAAMVYAPRSLQKRIGPSEIGEPCTRALINKLMGTPEPERGPIFKAWVGTAMHAELERIFRASPLQLGADGPRYLLEQRVTIGQIGGVDITGSCDLFDTGSHTAVDWKSKGKTTMRNHKRHGPGQKYIVQLHCYGLGMVNAGHQVNTVMDIFMPRDGEFRDIFYHAEPFNPQIAIDALDRCNKLLTLAQTVGTATAVAMYPQCDDEFCDWCPNRKPFGSPNPVPTTTAELFSARK